MKKFDYSQAQKRIEFATKVFTLATVILKFVDAALPLLSVAFNYFESMSDAEFS
ncbi:hypothetical protein [Pseudomonas sp. 13B_3.2_Bac1]|uniref:hypothetical protein n=1 Tax=Pseudomonas sp. 13B_3.2_Bac1 TaxID=2971623 RepID=UPI0021C58E44|nr:hypothetical protein [Pseudomonas sp. 13B_3.2_Bac1]MCU1770067.1 hypothetical protein [Pseudomonas sp. 13B_3.2_Bac1]